MASWRCPTPLVKIHIGILAGMGHDRQRLADDLSRLGLTRGDTVFVHSSFRSLGPVEGGAQTVIEAFEQALGPDGLLLMPSFNLRPQEERAKQWNLETCPSTVGWLTEYFRQMPGTVRSDHFSHSVAARGRGAEQIVDGHLSQEGMTSPWDQAPWGKTYGEHSPMIRAYRAGGKVLMLGVDYNSATYTHVVEVMYWNLKRQSDPDAEYRWGNRPVMGEFWDSLGRLRRGRVGDADCRLFPIQDFVDTLLAAALKEPDRLFKTWG